MTSVVILTVFILLVDSFAGAQLNTRKCKLPGVGVGGAARRYCPLQCKKCQEAGTCHSAPGSLVSAAVTRVQCAPGYRLDDNQDSSLVVCDKGNWIERFPECLAQCPALESDTVFPRCMYNGREVNCKRPMMPTTTATVECKPNHSKFPSLEKEGLYRKTLNCRYDGKWSHTLPLCKPDCGLSKGSSKVQATVTLDSVDTPLGVFPWHAGIYERNGQDWKYICGGSLITKRIVLTAAHCISSDPENLQIALAKYYRAWERDERHTVKLNVSAVSVPDAFSWAVTSLAWDIALILLSTPVEVNSYVMPVCQDARLDIDPTRDYTGYVVGWGKTAAAGLNSDYLLHNDVPISYQDNCAKKLPKVIAYDKFCASKNSTSVVEKGDSGGGLTVVWDHQHYIIGIVSVKYDAVSVFTNVSWPAHVAWMENEINNFEDDLSKCPNGGFQCGGGVCLAQSARCDGYRHCPDGSDEIGCEKTPLTSTEVSPTVETRICPSGRFQCSSGECLAQSARCDGYINCPDGSDEDGCDATTSSTVDETGGCKLPNESPTLRFCPTECESCSSDMSCFSAPGKAVAHGVTVRAECAAGYGPVDDRDSVLITCNRGVWNGDLPRCLAQCPPLESDSVRVSCTRGAQEVDCDRPTMPGTQATVQCRPSHTQYQDLAKAGDYARTLTCLDIGQWSYRLAVCKPIINDHSTSDESGGCKLPGESPSLRFCPSECQTCSASSSDISCFHAPGKTVAHRGTVRAECATGYWSTNNRDFKLITCNRERWNGDFPRCLAQCPPLESDSVLVSCTRNGQQVDCGRPTMPGTQATVRCRPSYTQYQELARAGDYARTLTCLDIGQWSYRLAVCKMV